MIDVTNAPLVAPVRVASASMLPTLAAADVVLMSRRSSDLSDIDRVISSPFEAPTMAIPRKRVISLPATHW